MSNETPQDSEFDAFYRATYVRTLSRLMYKWSSLSRSDAEEIVQDAYRRVWKGWATVRYPDAYLWTAVGHVTIDHWKKRGSTPEILCEDPGLFTAAAAPASTDPEQYVAVTHILSSFQQLSDADQKVIVMDACGESGEAQAEALGVTPGTARVRLCRARKKVGELIAQDEENE